jgi:hypothetical protein
MGLFDSLLGGMKAGAAGGSQTFTFSALPEDTASLRALPEASLDTPFKAAALTVCALCAYAANPDIGIEMLNFLKGPQLLSGYEISFLRDRFLDKKYVPFSYFAGSSPDNGYVPSQPFTVTVKSDPYTYAQEGYAKLLIQSSGADQARPVKLRSKGGQWFLWEQFLLADIRRPKAEDPWA